MHNTDTLMDVKAKEINTVNPLIVLKCKDFTLTGTGSNAAWENANWNTLTKLDTGGRGYESNTER